MMLRSSCRLAACTLVALGCAATDAVPADSRGGATSGSGGDGGQATIGAGGETSGGGWTSAAGGAPPTDDVCGNGIDDDGDGTIDEGCACEAGQTQSCWPHDAALDGIGACSRGTQTCVEEDEGEFVGGSWGPCQGAVGPSPETCANAADDDCDGTADEDCDGPDDPCAVGRALIVGCGRAFVWGDEHVRMESYWPDPAPYWDNAFAWLLDPGACAIARTSVWLGGGLPAQVEADLIAAGLTVTSGWGVPTAAELAQYDVVVLDIFGASPTPADGAALHAWVDAGGALMTMIVGIGSGQDECTEANPALAPFGVAYDCFEPVPWGPVATFGAHPIASGLAPINAPFVNGRFVVESDPATVSTVVASVSGSCPP